MKARQIMDFPRIRCARLHKPVAVAVCETKMCCHHCVEFQERVVVAKMVEGNNEGV